MLHQTVKCARLTPAWELLGSYIRQQPLNNWYNPGIRLCGVTFWGVSHPGSFPLIILPPCQPSGAQTPASRYQLDHLFCWISRKEAMEWIVQLMCSVMVWRECWGSVLCQGQQSELYNTITSFERPLFYTESQRSVSSLWHWNATLSIK